MFIVILSTKPKIEQKKESAPKKETKPKKIKDNLYAIDEGNIIGDKAEEDLDTPSFMRRSKEY